MRNALFALLLLCGPVAAQAQSPPVERLFWIDTGSLEQHVRDTLAALPDPLKAELFRRGVKITLVPTILSYQPQWAGQLPRGYRQGLDYRYVDSMYVFYHKEVVLSARSLDARSGEMRLNGRASYACLHELGHAFDRTHGLPSSTPAFASAYREDCQDLPNAFRPAYRYFLPGNVGGPKETFAELFMLFYRARTGASTDRPRMVERFPRCYALVSSLLAPYDR